MKYRIVKGNKPSLPSYGKYTVKAVHSQTVDFDAFLNEMHSGSSITDGTVMCVLKDFFNVLSRHLQDGDIVEIPQIGTFKMEIESRTFDSPRDFNPKDHVKRFSVHLLPKCTDGTPDIYRNVKLEKL